MGSEEKVFNWVKEKMMFCPGSATLTKADLKQVYKGPLKQILDTMATRLRPVEEVKKIQIISEKEKFEELFQRKANAELSTKKLEIENALLNNKCSKLVDRDLQLKAKLSETQEKVTLLRARKQVSKNQNEATECLQREVEIMGKEISPSLWKNKEAKSTTSSFKYNPNHKKLESVLKSDARKLLEELAVQKGCEEVSDSVSTMVAKHLGEDRWNVLLELQSELKTAARDMADAVDLERDAKMLRNELDGADLCTDIVRPLQRHLDALTLEHARLVFVAHHRNLDIERLEQQKQQLLEQCPEAVCEAEQAMLSTQVSQLHKNLGELILQDRREQDSQAEIARSILQIKNFIQDTEDRKNKIVQLLRLMNKASQLTERLKETTLQATRDVEVNLEPLVQLPQLLQGQLKLVSLDSLQTLSLAPSPSTAKLCVGLSEEKEMDCETFVSLAMKITSMKAQLSLLNAQTYDQNLDCLEQQIGLCENYKAVEQEQASLKLQLEYMENTLIKELASCEQKLADTLKIWKEQPIPAALKYDTTTTVAGMTFAQWIEYLEQSLPSLKNSEELF